MRENSLSAQCNNFVVPISADNKRDHTHTHTTFLFINEKKLISSQEISKCAFLFVLLLLSVYDDGIA
jgi:hypothetical protein